MKNKITVSVIILFFSFFVVSINSLVEAEKNLLVQHESINGTPVIINKLDNHDGDLVIIAHGFFTFFMF